jgi:NADPH-dependent 7-cyano-7-deazaguanine reductase QueF-like protein
MYQKLLAFGEPGVKNGFIIFCIKNAIVIESKGFRLMIYNKRSFNLPDQLFISMSLHVGRFKMLKNGSQISFFIGASDQPEDMYQKLLAFGEPGVKNGFIIFCIKNAIVIESKGFRLMIY